MPLQKGNSPKTIATNIREFHTGPSYQYTASKFGKKDADRQAVAVAMSEAKGRAMGGVAPMMANPGGMMSQAMQPMMPGAGMAPPNPSMPMGINPVNQPMPQTPLNGVAAGLPAQPMMTPPTGLNAGMPGPAGARGFAFGGGVAAQPKTFKGPIVSAVPGRTDLHKAHVPSGSFVIPADIVSGHGQGNTLAGMDHLQKLFKMGPHAANPSKIPGIGEKLSKGGSADRHVGKPVPVMLAGGEIVVPPENVLETMSRVTKKKLSLSQAHSAMDAWVLKHRKKLRKTLAGLPGPASD